MGDAKPDGTLLAKQEEPSELAEFINEIHMRVGIPRPWGIVSHGGGLAALRCGADRRRDRAAAVARQDFLALRIGKNLKRMWLDAHNVVGITALPFHIAMAITATALSFSDELWSVQETVIFGGKQEILNDRDNEPYRAPKPIGEAAAMMAPSQLLQKLKAQVPDFEPRFMVFKNFGDKAASVRVPASSVAMSEIPILAASCSAPSPANCSKTGRVHRVRTRIGERQRRSTACTSASMKG